MKNVVFLVSGGHPDAAKLTYFGLHSLQHRGQEGAGILSNDQGQLKRHRDMGLLSEVFRNPANLDKLTGTGAIGHVRLCDCWRSFCR